ncbi:hypothetical protein CFN58_16060 [Pseudomonas avellanae]|uniref:Uncharacterized protein n=1 Tax=Pseudomonas avellanae TaxID=46257 RepID=A0A261WIA9_9PSED|nr:hypothetical protein CFN58_16060 [Pseudomonas avellanae]
MRIAAPVAPTMVHTHARFCGSDRGGDPHCSRKETGSQKKPAAEALCGGLLCGGEPYFFKP